MRLHLSHRIPLLLLVTGLLTVPWAAPADACPFCFGSLQLTLRERIETPDTSLLVEWQNGEPGNIDDGTPAATSFRVLKVWRGEATVGQPLLTDHYYEGQPGDQFLLVGNRLEESVRWDRAIPLTTAAIEYVTQLPTSADPMEARLAYAFRHLESADETIANDAFAVVGAARYEEIHAAREHLDVEQLRRWVHDRETLVMRLGVYGMLLGLAGNQQDVPRLHERIFTTDNDRDIRVGIDGVMGGYLLLTGTDGLAKLDREYLSNPQVKPDNLNAVTSALRFMWEYGDGRISPERLRESMRHALDHEETLDIAIVDLARWQDWSITPRVVEIYPEAHRSLQRRIVGFLSVAAEASPEAPSEQERAAIQLAQQTLEQIKREDPALYRNARRGLIQR